MGEQRLAGRPVKVTAWLAGPIAERAPHLDALLEYVMVRHRKSVERTDRAGRHRDMGTAPHRADAPPPVGRIPIPIARARCGAHLVARCSDPIMRVEYESVAHRSSSVDTGTINPLLAESGLRSLHRGSGHLKSEYRPIRLLHCERVVWFAVARAGGRRNGHASMLRKVLRRIPAIGKHTAHGYGVVARWEVEIVERDWSWYAGDGGDPVLMRTLPADAHHPPGLRGYRRQLAAVAPPYWHPQRLIEALVPC